MNHDPFDTDWEAQARADQDAEDQMVTATGNVLTDADIEALSAEAEFGYSRDAEGRWGANMNRLTSTTDAMEWAEAFVHQFGGERVSTHGICPDVATMLAWFAGALETGRSAGRRELCPHTDEHGHGAIDLAADLTMCRICGATLP
jgi:hypothetical protein